MRNAIATSGREDPPRKNAREPGVDLNGEEREAECKNEGSRPGAQVLVLCKYVNGNDRADFGIGSP
ncbi:MAG TPA: hypothetical protein VF403_10345 [Kofleriaceae bacterium]